MSDDPYSPGYQPPFTGENDVAGNGTGFGADLFYLYRAGRLRFPELAAEYAEGTRSIDAAGPAMAEVASTVGWHAALNDTVALMTEAQNAIGSTSRTLTKTGEALVEIANTYAGSDSGANTEFQRLMGDNQSDYQAPPVQPGDVPTADY